MNRVIVLDLFRFFAAISVVLYHYTYDGYMNFPATLMQFETLGSVFKYGQLGVELFFMISGFVILLSTQNKSVYHFIVSRISRLYPAYWAGVSFTAIVIVLFGEDIFSVTLRQYLVNLTMIQEFFAIRNIDGVYWTLFVEIRFYFLVFLVMLFRQMKFVKYYLLGWSVLSLASWFYPINAYVGYYLILNVAQFFIAGSIFYMVYRDNGFRWLDYAILLLSFMSAVFYFVQKKSRLEMAFDVEMSLMVFISVLVFYFFIFFAVSRKYAVIKNDKRVYMVMGAVTYPLYLIHEYIGYIIFMHLSPYVDKNILLCITVLLMLVLAYFIHVVVERRFGKALRNQMFKWLGRFNGSAKND